MIFLNKTKNTIEGTFWGVFSRVVSIVFPFIIRTIIIKKLGAEFAGLNSLFTSVLQVLSLAELGFTSAMVFAMYKPIADGDNELLCALLRYYRKIYNIIGLVIFFIGLCITPFIGFLIKGDIPESINIYILFLIYLSNTCISYLFFAYRGALFSANQREAENSIFLLISNILMYITQIIVLFVTENYYIYIIFLPIFTLIFNVIRYIYSIKKYPDIKCVGSISLDLKKEIKKNISALMMHKIGNVTVNTLDNIVISSFAGLVLLANYNNYYYLISAITGLILVFFNALTAGIGNSIIVNNSEKKKNEFNCIFYINGLIVIVCTCCFFTMFQDFIALWVGNEYLFTFDTVVLFCIYFFCHTIRRTIIAYRDASGSWVDNRWQPIVSAAVNLCLNIVLIQIIGINGVIISTIIAMVFVDMPWETITLIKKMFPTEINRYWLKMFFFGLLTCFACLLCFFIKEIYNFNNIILKIFVDFITGSFVSLAIFILSTFWTSDFKYLKEYGRRVFRK